MFFLFLLFLLFNIIKYDTGRQNKNKKQAYWMCVAFLILLAAFRYRVGVDTMRLEDEIKAIPPIWELNSNYLSDTRFAPGFTVFCSILKIFSSDFLLYQIVQSLIVNICCCKYILRNTDRPFIALFFYFFAAYLFFCYETSREGLAIAMFLLFYDKKIYSWRNLFLAIICPLMHYGAVFAIVVMFARKVDLLKKKNIYLILLLATIVSLFIKPEQFYSLPILTTNEDLFYLYNHYFLESEGDGNLLYKIKLFVTLIPLLVYWLIKDTVIIRNPDIYNGFVIYIILIFVGAFLPIIGRLGNYLIIDYLLTLTWIIPLKTYKNVFATLCIVSIFNLPFMTVYYSKVANSKARYYRRFIPYNSIVTMDKDAEREKMYKQEF